MNDQPTVAAEPVAPDPVATRNKLLRVMRQVVEIKAGQRFIRSIADEPAADKPPARPASYFLGIDVQVDLQHLADELAGSVNELAEILRETPADPARML